MRPNRNSKSSSIRERGEHPVARSRISQPPPAALQVSTYSIYFVREHSQGPFRAPPAWGKKPPCGAKRGDSPPRKKGIPSPRISSSCSRGRAVPSTGPSPLQRSDPVPPGDSVSGVSRSPYCEFSRAISRERRVQGQPMHPLTVGPAYIR